jgi:hypothetical protein
MEIPKLFKDPMFQRITRYCQNNLISMSYKLRIRGKIKSSMSDKKKK